MRKLNCIFWLSLGGVLGIQAQAKKITIETKAEILWAGVDRPGDLFLLLRTGEVQKFNNQGKLIGSHGFRTPPTLMDPLDGVQSFYYLQEGNMYGNLSSDLSTASQHPLDAAFAILPWLVCPALHEFWILDSADHSIKKTSMNASTIAFETMLNHPLHKSVSDYRYMREYQNYLFLLDSKMGILLFNTVGKYIKTLGEANLETFGFLGEEMYYSKGNNLILTDLYTDEKRTLPLPVSCRFALLTDDTLYAVGTNTVTILDFKP